MDNLTRQTVLSDKIFDFTDLKIQSVDTGMVMIQQADLVKTSKLKMPEFGSLSVDGQNIVLSIMPNSWLQLCKLSDVAKNMSKYQKQIGKNNIIITDISDQYVQFSISGKHARALLAKGCELDLSLDKFKPNSCARTLLAHMNVVIWRVESDDLNIFIDVSFAEHLWLWLEGATLEYSK